MQYLAAPQISITHAIIIRASARQVLAALVGLEGIEDPLMGALIWLRAVPQRLLVSRDAAPVRGFSLSAFTVLHRSDDRLVLGMIGKFWKARPCTVQIADVDAFLAFDRPGMSRLVMSFAIESRPDASVRLTTSTHIDSPDRATRAKMALYWMAIRPGIALMRRRLLWLIKRAARSRQDHAR